MTIGSTGPHDRHNHVFLGAGHESSERRTWIVIVVCAVMMALEIVGGWMFGSIALVADGLHMSTHAGAMLLAALAYTFARRHAHDPRFSFGTGKLGDLAGFASAIILAMISLLIAYEAISRFFAPVPIDFPEAIAIAALGLAVNASTAWILAGGHGHGHGGDHGPAHAAEAAQSFFTPAGSYELQIFETGTPPRFRLSPIGSPTPDPERISLSTVRPDASRQRFAFIDRGGFLESLEEIPEPHEFTVEVEIGGASDRLHFHEAHHDHAKTGVDNNMRAAIVHIVADAAVSILVICGLILARLFGWLWIDPLVGLLGAAVIAAWAFGLVRDTGAILLDMTPDAAMRDRLRAVVEQAGDEVVDLHVWRLGPGHLGAIISIATATERGSDHYRRLLERFRSLSHLTIEVRPSG